MNLAKYVFAVVLLSAFALLVIVAIWMTAAGVSASTALFVAAIYSLWVVWLTLPFFIVFGNAFTGIFVLLKRPPGGVERSPLRLP